MSVMFFGICQDSMISVEDLEIEKWCEGEDTIAVAGSSHNLVPLSSLKTGSKLTTEDESYVDIQSISFYVTWICNSFWWVVMISLVDIVAGNNINTDFMHPHGPWKIFN